MTERTSASKRVEEKLDILLVEVYSIKGDLQALREKVDMQPKIDDRRFSELERSEIVCKNNYDKQIADVKKEVGEVKKEVVEIKDKPAKKLDMLWGIMVGAVIGVITNIIANVFKM